MSLQVMTGSAAPAPRPVLHAPFARVALLGCGNVGSEVVRLLAEDPQPAVRVDRALVRRPRAQGPHGEVTLTTSPSAVLANDPDVVVELLGGCDPARDLVLEALDRGVPVVTANKSLLARHGRALRAAATRAGLPLLYEAAVIAGVPFLGTFARRPLAAKAHAFTGVVNGTSNFILTESARRGIDLPAALHEAQRRGYAEPDPHNDIAGVDACEKLAVLLQHFGRFDVDVEALETEGITSITTRHHALASELGGSIKPVVFADWTEQVRAFAGPAFVSDAHPLSRVDGVENALLLETPHGRLLFQGPGAGPRPTAATVVDDVHEIVGGTAKASYEPLTSNPVCEALTGWLLVLEGERLPPQIELAEYFAAHDVYVQRTTLRHSAGGRERQAFLTWPVSRPRLAQSVGALERAARIDALTIRTLEGSR